MSRSRFVLAAVCCFGALAAAEPGLAQLVRLGGEFQVNTYTPGEQEYPAVGMDDAGDFVVAWHSARDGNGFGVFARRFSSAGGALASEFQVNVQTANNQAFPAIGVDGDGDFVIAWQSYLQDGSLYGIFARRFSSAGAAVGSEFLVNTVTNSNQAYAAVGKAGAGDFVVAWQSYLQDGSLKGVFARRFNAAGTALASEFQVNVYTNSSQGNPAVAMDGIGNFVVAWNSFTQDGSDYGIFARRFNAAGNSLATEFQANTSSFSAQRDPALAVDGDGDFVVAWSSKYQDGSSLAVVARRFASTGAALGGEIQVNVVAPGSQSRPAVGVEGDGDFVIAWQADDQDGSENAVIARRFDSAGADPSAEFQVNIYTPSYQYAPAIAMTAAGNFVVAWSSYYQDGSSTGVFAQRLRELARLDVDGNGTIEPLTDGLLVLRFEFGFTGAVLVNGAVDLVGCTRCDAPTIESYLRQFI